MSLKMSGKLSLLDNSSDSEVELTINKDYANKYDNWRNLEELQKYRDLKKAEDDSESSSESEEEVPEFDEEFFRALSLVKGKDPRIYDKNFELFTKKDVVKKPKAEKQKKTFMKDYERNLVLERGGKFSDEDDEEQRVESEKVSNEQMKALNSLKNLVKDSDDEDDDPILKERIKTEKEADAEEADYVKWLKGEEKDVSDDLKSDMSYLRNYWNDPKLDEGEKFLRDYILNKRYLDKDDSEIPTYAELTSGALSDDEKMIEEHEQFEHKYNFRFEEPDEEFIKRYPRTVGDSLRKVDTRRKQKREEKGERRQKEKEQRQEELKRLKALKRKEIEEKFMKLKEISGRDEINLDESDIESDFDPDKHDKKMKEMFDDEYYQVEEDQKPEFPFDEELDEENWNTWTREKCQSESKDDDEEGSVEQTEEGESQNETTTSYKDEFADEMIKASQRKKKARKKSLFAKVVSQAKPLYDPDGKSFDEYLDEYYKLDYEDVIGDMPVRYKYRKVIPNDFGLTVDEILAAEERELNRWCSVKKTCQYRNDDEELYDVQAFKKKAANPLAKKKMLHSIYAANDGKGSVKTENMYENNQFSKRKDSVKETHRQNESMNSDSNVSLALDISNEQYSTDITRLKRKSKKKKQKGISEFLDSNEHDNVDDSNLNTTNHSLDSETVTHDDELSLKEVSSDHTQDSKKKSKKKKHKEKLNTSQVKNELEHPSHENATEMLAASSEESSHLDIHINVKSTKRKRKDSETDSVVESDAKNELLEEHCIAPDSKRERISDSNEVNNENTSSENVNEVPSKKKKKKKRKNKNKTKNNDGNNEHVDSNFTHTKKHKKFDKKFGKSDDKRLGLSDERLAAYGINPKKFKNRIIYSEK